MKKCVAGVLCVLVFSMVWSGCTKSEHSKPAKNATDSLPGNTSNPYDSFGYFHNVILDSIQQQRSQRSVYGFSGSCDVIRKFYRSQNWHELKLNHFNKIPSMVIDATLDLDGYIDSTPHSDSVKVRLKQLFQIINNAAKDSCSYPRLKSAICSFEHEVLTSTLSQKDKEAILKPSSIARYSAYKWMAYPKAWETFEVNLFPDIFSRNQMDLQHTVISKQLLMKTGLFHKIAKWIAVTANDISCALIDLSLASGVAGSDFMKAIL